MALMIQTFNRWLPITKSDTVNFDNSTGIGSTVLVCDSIYVGGAGIVVAVAQDGTTANFTAVAGEILPLRAIRVMSTTTTATLMVALFQE